MLAIRLKRQGRKGHPIYRVIVQESQRHPSSGRVVAHVGTYNPHTKEHKLDKEKIESYLKNGAQPSPRVIKLLTLEKIDLPAWVKKPNLSKERSVRNPEKLRRNRPAEAAETKSPADEKPVETTTETSVEDTETEMPSEAASDDTEPAPVEGGPTTEGKKDVATETETVSKATEKSTE